MKRNEKTMRQRRSRSRRARTSMIVISATTPMMSRMTVRFSEPLPSAARFTGMRLLASGEGNQVDVASSGRGWGGTRKNSKETRVTRFLCTYPTTCFSHVETGRRAYLLASLSKTASSSRLSSTASAGRREKVPLGVVMATDPLLCLAGLQVEWDMCC